MRRPRADREEKRVTHGRDDGRRTEISTEQLDPEDPNQRRLLAHDNRRSIARALLQPERMRRIDSEDLQAGGEVAQFLERARHRRIVGMTLDV
jgi:hypothetical protein